MGLRSARTASTAPVWVEKPPDRAGLQIEILPVDFDTKKSGCVQCGGTLDFNWICQRCSADHFPAVKRLIRNRQSK